MKFFLPASLIVLASYLQIASAGSILNPEERNGLETHGPLQAGDVLRFPRGFQLHEFSAERGMATLILKGSDQGKNYVCAFAIEADTEVKFPEFTLWTVLKNETDGDITKIFFAHKTWGSLRPLEFRCAGIDDVNQVLMNQHILLPVEVPVELISD